MLKNNIINIVIMLFNLTVYPVYKLVQAMSN